MSATTSLVAGSKGSFLNTDLEILLVKNEIGVENIQLDYGKLNIPYKFSILYCDCSYKGDFELFTGHFINVVDAQIS